MVTINGISGVLIGTIGRTVMIVMSPIKIQIYKGIRWL